MINSKQKNSSIPQIELDLKVRSDIFIKPRNNLTSKMEVKCLKFIKI